MGSRAIRPSQKQQPPIPQSGLEQYPFEYFFELFQKRIQHLNAEHDVVNGLAREYISTSLLYIPYRLVFGNTALVSSTLSYRLQHIKPGEFPDDFLVLDGEGLHWEAKYFVNRLNHSLLKRIYLPTVEREMRELVQTTLLFEDDFITLHELDEEEE